ncbi:MAG TPA: ABC transporter substrate-binding protein [Usitatibacter sp.]|nr:ABC transporter substrate-binding protein [Usitatibacter sp.]
MNRRRTLAMLALAALPGGVLAVDQPARLKRVVLVKIGDGKVTEENRKRWIQGFAEEGLVDGRDVALEFEEGIAPSNTGDGPWTAESERRAREIVASRPAVIVAGGDKIHLFRKVTKEVPLVFWAIGRDPVDWGLVESYNRPGGNITGSAFPVRGRDSEVKPLELLKALRPGARRLGVLVEKDRWLQNPHRAKDLEDDRIMASKVGLENVEVAVPNDAKPAAVIDAIRRAKVDILQCLGGNYSPEVREFLVRERIPFACGDIYQGGLVYSFASWDENGRNAIGIVAQILRGANPATIPVRFPSRYYTKINLNTARELGITVPASVLLQADEVIDINPRSAR